MPEIEISAVDIGAALLITTIATEVLKRLLGMVWQPGEASKFAPLIALLCSSFAVAVVADFEAATWQDTVLAVVIVTAVSVGAYSFGKNIGQGVQQLAKREA
jgi:CDP-diglyceride synthetase